MKHVVLYFDTTQLALVFLQIRGI